MDTAFSTLDIVQKQELLQVFFAREKPQNAFSRQMTSELTALCRIVTRDADSDVPKWKALLIGGKQDCSFSVGGDFHDVSVLDDEASIREYLNEIIDLYVALLRVPVPVVSAVDYYAIGQGLQVALMTDWRIGSERCQLQMPELKNGVACPLGSSILEFLLGRARMLELLLDPEYLSAEQSRSMSLLNQVVSARNLQSSAVKAAMRLMAFPQTSFATTKKIHNARFVAALESARDDAAEAHVSAFMRKTGQAHFARVLKSDTALSAS